MEQVLDSPKQEVLSALKCAYESTIGKDAGAMEWDIIEKSLTGNSEAMECVGGMENPIVISTDGGEVFVADRAPALRITRQGSEGDMRWMRVLEGLVDFIAADKGLLGLSPKKDTDVRRGLVNAKDIGRFEEVTGERMIGDNQVCMLDVDPRSLSPLGYCSSGQELDTIGWDKVTDTGFTSYRYHDPDGGKDWTGAATLKRIARTANWAGELIAYQGVKVKLKVAEGFGDGTANEVVVGVKAPEGQEAQVVDLNAVSEQTRCRAKRQIWIGTHHQDNSERVAA